MVSNMSSDVLDLVVITASAVRDYRVWARKIAANYVRAGGKPEDLSEERGVVRGTDLVVYIDCAIIGRQEFVIPAGQWAWNDRN